MHHPVVRAPKSERLELMVGVADEVPIGEEQKLDDIPAQIGRAGAVRSRFAGPRIGGGGGLEKFMSAILTYLRFNVTKLQVTTKY
jgi:hypothetical protein